MKLFWIFCGSLIGCVGLSQNDPSEIPSTLLPRLVNWPGMWNDNV